MDLPGKDKVTKATFRGKLQAIARGFFILTLLPTAGCLLEGTKLADIQPLVVDDVGQKWHLLESHSDEFNSELLNLEKWEKGYENDYHGVSWNDENVYVNDGSLRLRIDYAGEIPNSGMRYYSGFVRKKSGPVQYGFFEARVKAAPRFPGVCSAFWAFNQEEKWWTEIDFVELYHRSSEPEIISFFRHVFRQPYPGLPEPYRPGIDWEASWDPSEDFHVYGCEWDENEIKWYVDGELVHSVINTFWEQPLDIVFSLELRPPLMDNPDSQGFPAEMLVDYVRVWKKLPEDR